MARQVMLDFNDETSTVNLNSDASVRELVKEAKSNVDKNYIELARLLYTIYHKHLYSTWGFISFEDYIDSELDFEYRKSMYLIDIWGCAKHLSIPQDRLISIGWTKAREIVRIADESNIDYWLTQAETLKCSELLKLIKEYKAQGNVKTTLSGLSTLTFRMESVDVDTVNIAVEEAMKLINTSSASKAIVMICTEWVMEKNIVPLKIDINKMLDYLEEAYDVKLVVSGKKEDDPDPFV